MVELDNGTVLDLGYGKIEPDEKHNFATFDQAAYTVLVSITERVLLYQKCTSRFNSVSLSPVINNSRQKVVFGDKAQPD